METKRIVLIGGGIGAIVLTLLGAVIQNPPLMCLPLPIVMLGAWALGLTR